MSSMRIRSAAVVCAVTTLSLVAPSAAHAQLKGHYIGGFSGLQNGTQGPPGISLFVPIYFYTTDDIRNDDGHSIGVHPRTNVSFIGPGVAVVRNAKLFGANYGASIAPVAFIKSRIEGNSLDVPGSFQFTDTYVQPIQLGWHTDAADVVAGYGLFVPTGTWELGGKDNSGLGMWSNELQLGTTVRLDRSKAWTVSALASYEIHSAKQHADIRVGDILTVEGGLGRSFYRTTMMDRTPVPTLITSLGLTYYGQFKVTADHTGALTPLVEGRQDRVFAVGFEGNMAIPARGLVLGLRVEPEVGARNRTQGWTFLFSTAYQLASLVRRPPSLTREDDR